MKRTLRQVTDFSRSCDSGNWRGVVACLVDTPGAGRSAALSIRLQEMPPSGPIKLCFRVSVAAPEPKRLGF